VTQKAGKINYSSKVRNDVSLDEDEGKLLKIYAIIFEKSCFEDFFFCWCSESFFSVFLELDEGKCLRGNRGMSRRRKCGINYSGFENDLTGYLRAFEFDEDLKLVESRKISQNFTRTLTDGNSN
jgi:hypothetical protein